MAEDDPLRELIEAVADGTLDPGRLPGTHRDPSISQLLAELHILAGVSEVHRSQVGSDEPTTASVATDSQAQPTPATGEPISGPVAAPLVPGTQWGNFELVRKVGEGTFGEVFQARDLWLGHDVALKLLKANVTDRARMLHEARMLVRVRHLNVVMVHGADVHGGRLGFWMDFVEGATLHDAIRREGPRSASEAFAWGQDLCRALAAVHGAGIIHRDVKAQNVMRRTSDGRLVLMDFGAGELLGTRRSGAAAGTPMYLAPELLHGGEASRSSDIYALGVLLFFLVSRKFPVQAASWDELLAAHERKERVRLEDVRPDMPSAFVDVVERALRPDPSQRYASAGEMLAAMRGGDDSGPLGLRSSTPLPIVSPPPTSQVSKTVMNATWLAAGVFGLTLVLGYVACTAFEVAFRIDPLFTVGFSSYLTVGREAVMPFLLNWVAASALVAIFGGGRHLLQTWSGGDRLLRGRAALTRIDPVILGTAICAGGLLALVATYLWFRPIFTALDELRTGVQAPTSLQLLAPGGANSAFGEVSALLSFLMGFAAWKWFPGLERRAAVPATLRGLRWATWGVALLVVVIAVIPRRIVWDEFEVVQYEKRQAFVLASRGEQLLLYLADSPGQPLRRVSATGTPLERTGARQKLFAPPS